MRPFSLDEPELQWFHCFSILAHSNETTSLKIILTKSLDYNIPHNTPLNPTQQFFDWLTFFRKIFTYFFQQFSKRQVTYYDNVFQFHWKVFLFKSFRVKWATFQFASLHILGFIAFFLFFENACLVPIVAFENS